MSKEKKYSIDIRIVTAFLPDQSDPSKDQYAFAYTITIHNAGKLAAQLLSRHWLITNAEDKSFEVKGDGVVGEQPLLPPGQTYEYTSGVIIDTPVGTMQGSYQMIAEDGHLFEAQIPAFTLAPPQKLH